MSVKDAVLNMLNKYSNQKDLNVEGELWNMLYNLLYYHQVSLCTPYNEISEFAKGYIESREIEIYNNYPTLK